jgi:hypothetical protein
MNEKRRIGLKYCGGCNPRHDRVAAAAQIKQRLEGRVEFVPHDDEDAEGILIIAGCPTVCVDRAPFGDRPVWTVASAEDAERFIDEMNKTASRSAS